MSASLVKICPRCGYSVEGALPFGRAKRLFERIAKRLRISPVRLRNRNRDRYIVEKRWVTAWVLRSQGAREIDIARLMGRDHSSISHGLRQLQLELKGENASAWQRLLDLAARD